MNQLKEVSLSQDYIRTLLFESSIGVSFNIMEPRPASSVMLIRDKKGGGIEVLMLERSMKLEFVGGAFVFPGGAVDSSDSQLAHSCIGLNDEQASIKLGLKKGGISFYVAAIRECFEEAGLLLARSRDDPSKNSSSGHISMDSGRELQKYQRLRSSLNRREVTFSDLVVNNGLELMVSDLAYVSHWVTPIGRPRRYDTRFFLAAAPGDQDAVHDNGEAVNSVWIEPHQALTKHGLNEMTLVFPTISNLKSIAEFSSVSQALSWASSLEQIPRTAPIEILQNGELTLIVPTRDSD